LGDHHDLRIEGIAQFVANEVIDTLHIEPGRQTFLHAVDES
jgi:hypothetical protein